MILMNYDSVINYVGTKDLGEADALSYLIDDQRSFLHEGDTIIAFITAEVCMDFVQNTKIMPVIVETVREETERDPLLQAAMEHTIPGRWPTVSKDNELYHLMCGQDHRSIVENCLIYSNRIVIPRTLQEKRLKMLHEGYPGNTQTKKSPKRFV